MKPRWLVFAIGNPSRGDDALGPALAERLEEWLAGHAAGLPVAVTVLTDFQCQVEHALDLQGVAVAIFVDAAVDLDTPFALTPLAPARDGSHTTHALSPAAVLQVALDLGQTLPDCWQLAIAGSSFDLGEDLSAAARDHLDHASAWLTACLTAGRLRLQSARKEPSGAGAGA